MTTPAVIRTQITGYSSKAKICLERKFPKGKMKKERCGKRNFNTEAQIKIEIKALASHSL